jgi:hypothetical protein
MKSLKEYLNEAMVEESKFNHGFWNKVPKWFKKVFNKHAQDYDIPAVIVSYDWPGFLNGDLDEWMIIDKVPKFIDAVKDYIETKYKSVIDRTENDTWQPPMSDSVIIDTYYSFDDDAFDQAKEDLKDAFAKYAKEYFPHAELLIDEESFDNRSTISFGVTGVKSSENYNGPQKVTVYPTIEFGW